MLIEDALRFDNAQITSYHFHPSGKGVLSIKAPLTRRNAELLNAEYLFVRDTVPRENAQLVKADLPDATIEITAPNDDTRLLEPVWILNLTTTHVEKIGVQVSFNAHFTGESIDAVWALCRQLGPLEFNCVVRPKQIGLFEGQEPAAVEAPQAAIQSIDEPRRAWVIGTVTDRQDLRWSVDKASAVIRLETCDDGWRAGYEVSFGFRHAQTIKAAPSEMLAMDSEALALSFAAAKVHGIAQARVNGEYSRQEKIAARQLGEWVEKVADRPRNAVDR